MPTIFSAIFLAITLITLIDAFPTTPSPRPRPRPPPPPPPNPCTNISSQATQENYTSIYLCSLKTDYAIFGLYYDSCTLFDDSTSNTSLSSTLTLLSSPSPKSTSSSPSSSPPSIPIINTLFCCDPTYTTPSIFDALCVWGNGTNMAEWKAQGHPPGQPPTTSEAEMEDARCFVGPIINPSARCIQVGVDEGMEFLRDMNLNGL